MHSTSHFSQLKDFLSYLATVKGDLSSITAPPFVLAPKSAIEISSAWAARQPLFLEPATEPDAARRALLVAKNYICSLKQLVGDGSEDAGKKPLNPFLGELFFGQFEGSGGATKMVAEQVSHHPPVTACFMYNEESGITSNGFVAQEMSFSMVSGVTVHQAGYAIVSDTNHNEQHLMTMPTLHVKGLATGQPYSELEGPCYISSSTGFVTCIEFDSSTFGLGDKNRVKAHVYENSGMKKELFKISGQWNAHMKIKDAHGKVIEEFDIDDVPLAELHVEPVEQQTPWESRRAWKEVIYGIKTGNFEKVTESKAAVEESQRERRKEEESQGTEWKRLFFTRAPQDDEARGLVAQLPADVSSQVDVDKTAGAWKFVGLEAAREVMAQLRTETGEI
ncbi:Oxysterol-binding protein [Paramyrothecium foliicola]|nr:Oxysterol-binding protein [Paramyrothecium foliicola]